MLKKEKLLIQMIRGISYALVLLPVAFGFLYVYLFGVNVPFQDQWLVVPLFERLFTGTLSIWDLFEQINEHRIFFPRITMLLLGVVTRYDTVAEMYLIEVYFLVMLIVLLLAFKSSIFVGNTRRPWLLLFVPVPFLIFSLRQVDNMLWGIQIVVVSSEMFSVLALFLLYKLGRTRFIKSVFAAALASATVASFSYIQGLLLWPAGLLQLFLAPVERPAKRFLIGAWGLIGFAEWAVYFYGWSRWDSNSSYFYALAHPIATIDFFLTLLGASLFWTHTFAFFGGLSLACLAVIGLVLTYRNGGLSEYRFWIALLFFSFLVLASIAVGRIEIRPHYALRSAYTTFSIPFVVSVYAMLVKLVIEGRSRVIAAVSISVLSGLLLLSVPLSYSRGITEGESLKADREEMADTLYAYRSQPDELYILAGTIYAFEPDLVRQHAPRLEQFGYSVFSKQQTLDLPPLSDLTPVASTTSANIETIDTETSQQPIVVPKEERSVTVAGWAVDADAEDAAGGVYLDIDGRLFPTFYGLYRGDVADALGNLSYRYSGYEETIPTSEIGTGPHRLSIIILTNDREGYYRPEQEVAFEVR